VHNQDVTQLLYYDDPTLVSFTASVERISEDENHTEVVLNRTAFYPEGGGQPADLGTINGTPVAHVRKEDGTVFHRLMPGDRVPRPGDEVQCTVDQARRRDYMQQHTGQHIISAALMEVGDFNTVSVHQGTEYTTIEIDAPEITPAQLEEVERRANRTIEDDVPVTSLWVTDREIANYPLRRPPKVSGSIRLVRIGEVDCVACGGVHAERTGQVRLVHALGVESIRGRVRIAWKIGDRALDYLRLAGSIVRELGDYLSAQPHQLVERVEKQEDRARQAELEVRKTRTRLYQLLADSLVADQEPVRGRRVVTAEFEDDDRELLRGVAKVLADQTGVAACLTNRQGDQLYWSVVIAPGAGVEYADLAGELLPVIDGKGGGKPPIWQGVGSRVNASGQFLAAFARLARNG
jgi:alanyl-tRNA synthetase